MHHDTHPFLSEHPTVSSNSHSQGFCSLLYKTKIHLLLKLFGVLQQIADIYNVISRAFSFLNSSSILTAISTPLFPLRLYTLKTSHLENGLNG